MHVIELIFYVTELNFLWQYKVILLTFIYT